MASCGRIYIALLAILSYLISCSKNATSPANCPALVITADTASSHPCVAGGSISITSPVGNGISYKIGNSAFQSSPVFSSLLPGTYKVVARDNGGCEYTSSIIIPESNAGTLFTAVKSLLAANCLSCHSGVNPQAGHDWTRSCDILNNWDRIKARAVDGNPSPMPQTGLLPLQERNKISAWITAGHGHQH